MIDSFTEGDNGMSTIYFTLSTWNPYTVVLMKADLELRSAGEAPPDDTDSTSFNQSEISFKNETMQPPSGVTLRTPGQADITQTSVALTWTENTNVDFARYEVFQSSASGSLGSSVATILTRVSTECEVGGLSPDTTYYFTIRVFDAEGLCADSNQVGVRTKARFPFLIVGVGAIMVLALGVAVMALALRKSEPRTPVPPPP